MMIFVGWVAVIFATLGLIATIKNWKKKSAEELSKLLASVIFFFICSGVLFWLAPSDSNKIENTSSSVSQSTSTQTSASSSDQDTVTQDQTSDNATPREFSVNKPVPDEYLKDFMSFMKTYHDQIYAKVHDNKSVTIDDSEWSFILSQHNADGWDRYNKIVYVTDASIEKEDQFNKRTDVAKAWTALQSLSMTYDSFLCQKGKTQNDIIADEKDFDEAFQKASAEVR